MKGQEINLKERSERDKIENKREKDRKKKSKSRNP
jgi:hypothetical protein